MKKLSTRVALVAGAMWMAAGSTAAVAGTSTSNMAVSASVTATCSINAGPLSFGAYDAVAGTQVDGTATVSVACTQGAGAVVTLGQGTHAATGSTDAAPLRRLGDGGTGFLSYSLFSNAGRTTVWGNTSGTGLAYNASSNGASNLTVYGRITGNQDVVAGSYSDTVVATITF